jgi:hypothetical protein
LKSFFCGFFKNKFELNFQDSRGLLVKGRSDIGGQKAIFAKKADQLTDFFEMVNFVKPTAIIGGEYYIFI